MKVECIYVLPEKSQEYYYKSRTQGPGMEDSANLALTDPSPLAQLNHWQIYKQKLLQFCVKEDFKPN